MCFHNLIRTELVQNSFFFFVSVSLERKQVIAQATQEYGQELQGCFNFLSVLVDCILVALGLGSKHGVWVMTWAHKSAIRSCKRVWITPLVFLGFLLRCYPT